MSQASDAVGAIGVDLYFELQDFYARQTQLLDGEDGVGFAATFTEDGKFVHLPRGEVVSGRHRIGVETQANLESLSRQGIARRHWFNMLVGEVGPDGVIRTRFSAIITRTDAEGSVSIEPTCEVEDVLVRDEGRLLNHSRTVRTDVPTPR
ncbi:nuclear transport factor 2 family protein [Catellatospora tritici]|uniref:nuclear transport factor 2 family protein n=1 Tax=Catellatospora tritici TaxID=2851566 RepID=UPI001C2DB5E9|nr:nuclear transport factor 2 family protein [Catellatospora tritici]MBV1855594.1 nuclear transport factor 2 family protein [Catellatospora tritici]